MKDRKFIALNMESLLGIRDKNLKEAVVFFEVDREIERSAEGVPFLVGTCKGTRIVFEIDTGPAVMMNMDLNRACKATSEAMGVRWFRKEEKMVIPLPIYRYACVITLPEDTPEDELYQKLCEFVRTSGLLPGPETVAIDC